MTLLHGARFLQCSDVTTCSMVNNAGIFCGLAIVVDESVEAFDEIMVHLPLST